jgi:hypothetical protein
MPGLVGETAPNTFVVHLHPGEETPFVTLGETLKQELFRYLAAEAHQRGLRWTGPVTISFVPDATVTAGTSEVEARIVAAPNNATWRDVTLHTPTLYGVSGFAAGHTYPLRLPRCTIGRGPACDVRLGDPKVSHQHAAISWAVNSFCIEDLGSTAGTYRNDAIVSSPTLLRPGDHLRMGHSILRFDQPVPTHA